MTVHTIREQPDKHVIHCIFIIVNKFFDLKVNRDSIPFELFFNYYLRILVYIFVTRQVQQVSVQEELSEDYEISLLLKKESNIIT